MSASLSSSSQSRRRVHSKHGDTVGIKPADRQRFQELADQWERDTVLLSFSDQATKHPAYRKIVNMGELAVPMILERTESQSGHWFNA